MTEAWIKGLIDRDELWRFYKTPEWIKLKKSVLKAAHYECAECARQGKITRYDVGEDGEKRLLSTVHHVCHVKSHPELALSLTYKDFETGEEKINLLPVCKSCHNKLHPEKNSRRKTDNPSFSTPERW